MDWKVRNNNPVDIASLILQLYNLILLMRDFNNSDIMQELQNQDEQYLKKINKQNEEIIKLLKKGSD